MTVNFSITDYRFGSIVINNTVYTSDLIITPEKIISDWWRKESHLLTLEDLPQLDWPKLNSVMIGTGKSGKMKVDRSILKHLEKHNISFIIKRTPVAVREYNRSVNNLKLGIFHLTC